MPTDQTAQQINTFVAQPINNLLVFQSILGLVVVLAGAFLFLKFAPALINLYKQQAETNRQNAETAKKLTQIVEQNASQSQLALQSVDNNTAEMSKQTSAIEAQTTVIEGQGRDFRSYQTLVSDNMSAHTAQIDANTAAIGSIDGKVTELRASIDALTEQIQTMLEDKPDCLGFTEELQALERRLMEALKQPVNAVSATVLVDTAPAPEADSGQAANQEAA